MGSHSKLLFQGVSDSITGGRTLASVLQVPFCQRIPHLERGYNIYWGVSSASCYLILLSLTRHEEAFLLTASVFCLWGSSVLLTPSTALPASSHGLTLQFFQECQLPVFWKVNCAMWFLLPQTLPVSWLLMKHGGMTFLASEANTTSDLPHSLCFCDTGVSPQTPSSSPCAQLIPGSLPWLLLLAAN